MIKTLRDLFQVPGFYFHFIVTSVVYLVLPNIIFRVYDSHSNQYHLHGHKWYLNFDGVHYFYNLYDYEPNHAFLPLYVNFVQVVRNAIRNSWAIGLLILVNKTAFLMAAADLNAILRNLSSHSYSRLPKQDALTPEKRNEDIVRMGLLIFLYNPAGIFFNVVYTESVFCLLSFKAVRYLLQRQYTVQSVILMSLSVAIRSNGMFLAPVIGLELLTKFFSNLKRKIGQSFMACIQGISIITMLALPFIAHNIYAFYNICQSSRHQSIMCKGGLLSFYGAVQDRYWNVGFLRYFHMGNIVFIIIGAPAVIAGFLSLFQFDKSFDLRQKGLYLSFVVLFTVTAVFTNIQSSTRFFCGHAFFYFAMAKLALGSRLVRLWVLFYWLVGIFMYTVNFPWT